MFKNSCIKTGWYMYQLVSQWRVPAILLRTRNHWKPIVSTKIINAQTEFQRISESKLAGQHATCFHFHWRYLSFVRVWCAIFTTFFFTIHAILTSSCALCLYSCWRRELRDLSPEGHLEVGSASVRGDTNPAFLYFLKEDWKKLSIELRYLINLLDHLS